MPDSEQIRSFEVDAVHPDWDAFVARAGGDIVQTTMWGMTKRARGHEVVLTEARDRHGSLVGGALVIVRRLAPGIRIGYVARGPVCLSERATATEGILEALFERKGSQAGLIIQPMSDDPVSTTALHRFQVFDSPISLGPSATVVTDLGLSEEEIMVSMTKKRRYELRKALAQDIAIAPSDDVELFHRLHVASAMRQGFSPVPLSYLQSQWDALAPAGAIKLLVARVRGVPAAALWLSQFGGRVTYRLPGWARAAAGSNGVNYALHWAAMNSARSDGSSIYDFGGIDPSVARIVLSGHTVPSSFARTSGYFKLAFSPAPEILPQTRIALFNRPINWIVQSLAPKVADWSLVSSVARKLRTQ